MTVALAVGAALCAAGCGGHAKNSGIASASGAKASSSAAPSPTASVDRQQQLVNFARCMRAHGVQMDDPAVDSNGGVQIMIPRGTTKDKATAAQEACKKFLPNGGTPPTMSPQQLEQARKYAACMRQHGIDMSDPDPNGGRTRINKVDPNDPKFKAALDACRSLEPKGRK
jgi:hypothetical protein